MTMTLATTPRPELDPLLQSGVIAVVRVSEPVRLGPGYIRDLLAPLPFLRLVPSGGVTLENAGDWIRAGAAAGSVGSALTSAALLADDATAELTARARLFVECVAQARHRPGDAP